jgi:precorrin-6Y C5,15-methyltransferase (decarboxylating)
MRMPEPMTISEQRDIAAKRWLSIVGIGEDGVEGLSAAARRLVSEAELVVGGRRHLELARLLIKGETLAWPSPIDGGYPAILARRGGVVVVLASGDPFFYGVGKQLAALVPAEEIFCLPQPSAFSLAASRLGWALQDVALVTLHGRALEGIIRHLQPGRRILALSWDGTTPCKLGALLAERGLGNSKLTVLEKLGGPNERARAFKASDEPGGDVDPLNTIALEVVADEGARIVPLSAGLDDYLFEHDGQLTKREVRALVLSSLAPRHGELLWDIGLGAGSIAIEWLLRDASLKAIGVEENEQRAARAWRNALSLGTPDLEIVQGHAPEALAGLAVPDAVFIGGGIGDAGVFEAAWAALKPGGRLVANAVTIEGEARVASLRGDHGGELVRLSIARAGPVGSLSGWHTAMPITHWRVIKP